MNLYEDLLVKIMRLVDSEEDRASCSLVSKQWYHLERLSREKITLRISNLTENHLERMSTRYPVIRSLRIDGLSVVDAADLHPDSHACFVRMDGIPAIAKYWSQIINLDLSSCPELSDVGFIHVLSGCTNTLRTLCISECDQITDSAIKVLTSFCPNLETLVLESLDITDQALMSVAARCSSLKCLKLLCPKIGDDGLQMVGQYCASLESLILHGLEFTDKSLRAIGSGCKQLKYMVFSSNSSITDKGLQYITSGCPELMNIQLSSCVNFNLKCIGFNCKFLCRLILQDVSMQSDSLIQTGKNCKLLQILVLQNCAGVGDESICSISTGCGSLKRLRITDCSEVTNLAVKDVGQNCKFLTDLCLSYCKSIGNAALLSVSQGCSLHRLNVSGCDNIGDEGIVVIARCCPQLIVLDVSYLQNISDEAMKETSTGCALLRKIMITNCLRLTDLCMEYFSKNCELIEYIKMTHCPGITGAGIAAMVVTCKRIKKIVVEKSKVDGSTERIAGSIIQPPNDDDTEDESDDENDFWYC